MPIASARFVAAFVFLAGIVPASAATLSFENVTFPGTGVPLTVTGSDGNVFTFSAGPDSQFEAFQSGFPGSFPNGSYILTEGLGRTDPILISFANPIASITLPVASDRVNDSAYTTTVQFFDGADLLGTITKTGNTINPAQLFGFGGPITSLLVSTSVAASDAPFGYTQNLGAIGYNISAVPLPASAPMFGAAVLAVGLLGYGAKRRTSRAAG